MDKLTNIDKFNLVAVRLFSRLYGKFSVPEKVEISQLAYGVGSESEDKNVNPKIFGMVAPTLIWLAEEGFIKFDINTADGKFTEVILTLKGMTVLGTMPSSISESSKETFISKINTIVASGTKEAAIESTKNIVTQLFSQAVALGVGAN